MRSAAPSQRESANTSEHLMSEFVKIAKTTDLPDPGKQTYEIEDSFVVLFHVGGRFY